MQVYTDGGCIGNPGPGGFGVAFIQHGEVLHQFQQGFLHTTNNRMEYRAVIYALKKIKEKNLQDVTLYTDSKYVLESVTNWGHKWKRLGWKRNKSGSEQIQNLDLFKTAYLLSQELDVTWKWVKGHVGNRGNELVDTLANSAALWPKEKQIEDSPLETDTGQSSLF